MSKVQALAAVVIFVVVGVAARVLPHIPNFAPVTATALFCGVYMGRRYSLVALFVILAASDYLLLYINPFGATNFDRLYAPWEVWHNTLPYVYASFGISALVGWYIQRRRRAGVVVLAALFSSAQFFLITNAGVWAAGAYARGIEGLWQSYAAGLPFFRGTVLGDLFYTAAFFGLYELVRAFAAERAAETAKAVAGGQEA